jgi:hypothetical protein
MGSGIMGAVGSHQQAQAQADYQNESARRNYEYANRQRALDWQNQLSVWAVKRNEYQQQVGENFSAADRAYASEQAKLNEQFEAAALQKQDMMAQLIGLTGANRASERSGRSVQRLDTAAVAAFGRNQAIMTKNLVSARNAMIQRTYDNTLQLDAANRRAYNNVAVAPTPGIAPPQPVMVAGPSGMGLAAGILGGVASGIGAFNSLKAPDAGSFNNSWGYGQTGGMKTFGSDLFTPKTNFTNPYTFGGGNSINWKTSMNWQL